MLSKSVGHLRTWSSSCTRRDHEENYNRQQRSRSTADVTGGKNNGSTTRGTYQFISSYQRACGERQGIIDEEAEDQQARRVRGKKEKNMKNGLRVGVGAVGGGQQKSVTNDSVGHEQQTKQQYLRNDQEKSKEASYNHLRHAASLQLSKNSSRWQHEMKNASTTSTATATTSSAGKNSLNSLLSSGKQNLKVIPPRRSQKSLCTSTNKGVDHSTHHDETGTTSAPALFRPNSGFSSAGKMAESLSNQEEIKVMNYKANTDSVTPPYAFSASAVPKLNLGHLLLTSRTSTPASAPDLAVSKQNLQSKMPFWDQDVNKKAVYEEHVEDLDNIHATTSKTPEVVNDCTYAAVTTTVHRNASSGGASWKKMNSVSPCSAASTECPKISMMDLTGCTSMLGGDGATSVSGGGGGGSCGGHAVPGSSSSTVEGASCFVEHNDTTAHDLSTFNISSSGAGKENVTTCITTGTSSATPTDAGQAQQLSVNTPTVLFEPPQPASSWSEEDGVDSRAIETKSGSTVYRNKPALPDPDATSRTGFSSRTHRGGVANPYTIFQNARPDEKVTLRTPRGFEVQPADSRSAATPGAGAYAKEPAPAATATAAPVAHAQVVSDEHELPGVITVQQQEHQEQEIFHPKSPRMHRLLSVGSSCGTTTSLGRRGCAPTTTTFNASSSNRDNPSTSCTNKVIRKVVGGGQRFLAPPPPLQHTLMGVGTVLQPGSLSRRNSASRFSSPVSRGVTEHKVANSVKNTGLAPTGNSNVTTSTSMLRRSLCPSPSAARGQRLSDDPTLVKNHSGGGGDGTAKIVQSLQQSTRSAACQRTTPLSMSPVVLSPRPLPGTSQILAAKTEQNKVAIPTPTSIKFSLGLTPPKLSLFPPGIGGGGDRDEMNKDGGGQQVKLQARNKTEADASTWENGNNSDENAADVVFVEQDVDVPSDNSLDDDQGLHHAVKNPPQNSSERIGTNVPVPVATAAAASPSGIDNEVIGQQAYARTTVGDGNALCDNHFEDFQMQRDVLHHGKIEGCFAPAGVTAEKINQQTTILGRGRSASRFLRPGGITTGFQFSDRRNGSLERERKMMGVTTTRLEGPQLRSASVQPKSMQHQLQLEVESASTSSTSRRRLLQPSPSLSASAALRSKSSMLAAGSFVHQMNHAGNKLDAGTIGVVIPPAADQSHELKTGNKTKFVTPTLQEPKIPAPAAHAGLRPLWSPREQQPPRPEQGEMKQSSLTSAPVIPVVTTSTTSQQQEHQEAEVQRPPSAVSCSLPSGTSKISSGSATPAQLLTTPRQLLQPAAQQTAALSATSFLFPTRGPPHSSAVPSPIPTPRFGFGRDSRKNSNTFSFGNLATSSRLPFPLQAGTSGCLLAKNSSPSAPSR
ncbi:unnamed protein product [Amoebophrya sp. A120]|nr:unnamed protein product [Amoebophrya sp. A120]|eukprot:GSA120T00011243001.1